MIDISKFCHIYRPFQKELPECLGQPVPPHGGGAVGMHLQDFNREVNDLYQMGYQVKDTIGRGGFNTTFTATCQGTDHGTHFIAKNCSRVSEFDFFDN